MSVNWVRRLKGWVARVLHIEAAPKNGTKSKYEYLKIHLPVEVLCEHCDTVLTRHDLYYYCPSKTCEGYKKRFVQPPIKAKFLRIDR